MPAPIYVPGRQIRCTSDAKIPEFHTRGWYPPEAMQTWIEGVEGEIKFSIRRPEEFYTFRAEVIPFSHGGMQTLEVFFNFFRVGYFEVNELMQINVSLPFELFILRTAQIVLHCKNAMIGTKVGLNDLRRLGIALRSWIVD